MIEIVLTSVPIESGIVYSYVDSFLYGPGKALVLPPYNVEVVRWWAKSSLLAVYLDGRGLFEVFLVSFTQCPWCFPYVHLTVGNVPHW